MYTIQENVRIVIAALKQYNIRQIVLSPGGTNIPITQAVQNDPFFKCYSIPDERSAMYFAIGLYLQTGEVIATSCTSAQATRNYIPGLTEAFYKHAPILAITTSKLERFQYQEYMQAPDQCSLPKDSVKRSFDLPPVTDENTRIMCTQYTKEAILELTHRSSGPVQINIRINDSQQGKFEDIELPLHRTLKRYMAWDDWSDLDLKDKKILIVIGEHRPFTARESAAIENFCAGYNTAIYVNHLSNYSGKYSIQANLLLSSGGIHFLQPDLIITIGGQTGDYSLFGSLSKIQNAEHWRISEEGDIVDTYNKLTKVFECPSFYFFEKLTLKEVSSHTYFEKWNEMNNNVNYDVELPFSNIYVAQQLFKNIPQNSIMNFAILNSLRSWSYFPLDPSIQCYSNVAAFGIDGCNSMLIGESINSDDLSFIVTGDLAFFYDMNALGIRHIKNNLRILLINNNGGAEFKIMTDSWKQDVNVESFISACGHNGNAKGWAENCGFNYLSASNKCEFKSAKDKFIQPSEVPIIFEVFTNGDDENIAKELITSANKIQTTSVSNKIKENVRNIIGSKGVKVIKEIIGK